MFEEAFQIQDDQRTHSPFRLWWLTVAALLGWTAAVCFSFDLLEQNNRRHFEQTALHQALALIEKDLLYRRWNALQGGVYAPVSDAIQPNPWLKVPERDIHTPSGRPVTLINPAYMTRLVHALGREQGSPPARLSALRPISPLNAADPWEEKTLRWLEENPEEKYFAEPVMVDGQEALRVMVPLRMEAPCLHCHEPSESKVGGIRGGIDVAVPLKPFAVAHGDHRRQMLVAHLAAWLLGLGAVGTVSFFVRRRILEREAMHRQVAARERLWRSVVDSLQDPLIVLDAQRTVRLINPAGAALTDRAVEEIQGKPCQEVFFHWHAFSGGCSPKICPVQRAMETGKTSVLTMPLTLRDGSTRHFHVVFTPMRSNGGPPVGVIGSFREVTEQVVAHRALKQKTQEMRQIFQNMFGGFALHEILTDENGRPVDYRFLDVNPAFEQLTGLKAQEVVGKTLRDVLPDAASFSVERYGRVALTGEPTAFEAYEPSLQKHFSIRAFQPKPGQFGTIFFDITERKKAEEALEKSARLFRDLFEKSSEIQLLVDPEEARIVDANEAAEKFYGWSRRELRGMALREICTVPETEVRARLERVAKGQGEKLLTRHRTASMAKPSVEVNMGPVTLDGKTYVLCFVHDVTQREQLEEQLRHAQKMQAIGQLAGGVAHEFNNILQVMNGFVEMVLKDLPADDSNRKKLDRVLEGGLKAARLVQQLLAFSRKQILRPVPADLNEMVGDFCKMARKLVGETIAVHFASAPDLWTVKVDRPLLEQVLLNLVINARDAMPQGGKLLLETANVVLDEGYVKDHPHARPGPYVMISVTDTGCGMTPEVMERIFEPFYTTKEVGKGTGLGLSVAYGIVKQHDGLIHVYSEPDKGTTFRIYLPRFEGEAEKTPDVVEPEIRGGTETILLAEDDPGVRSYLVTVLREAGYHVVEARNGVEAVEQYVRHMETVDLLVCDMVMPTMGGEEAVAMIRRGGRRIPVVFMSGYPGRVNGVPGPSASDSVFLEKPIKRGELLKAIRSLLD
ncbi:PAS domain S-box protein [Desulfosoma sp.]